MYIMQNDYHNKVSEPSSASFSYPEWMLRSPILGKLWQETERIGNDPQGASILEECRESWC